MISYLSGKIIAERESYLILDVGGVGYKVHCARGSLSAGESKCELFIHNHIREDSNDLYGFKTIEALELFEKLISVNGVGPKAGMAIMAMADASRIIEAIISEDVAFFQAIPGIGKKVAAKIILDLKSKVSGLAGMGTFQNLTKSNDVADALLALGYKSNEIGMIMTKIPADISSSEDKVRWCLKNLAK